MAATLAKVLLVACAMPSYLAAPEGGSDPFLDRSAILEGAKAQQHYQHLSYGSASCPAGTDIVSQAECIQAIADLGIVGLKQPWVGTNGNIPKWCSVRQGGSDPRAHFAGSASGGVGRSDLAPVCKAQYRQLSYGSASCPAGTDIVSQAECLQAIADLGIAGLKQPWVGTNGHIPKWCSVRQGGNDPRAHFAGSASGGLGRTDLAPVCKAQAAQMQQQLEQMTPEQLAAGVCTVTHGRLSFSIDGFSDSCCDATSDVGNWVGKNLQNILQCNAEGPMSDPWCQHNEAVAKEKSMKVVSSCCNSDDKNVLATLIPEEAAMDPNVARTIDMVCSQMGGPSLPLLSLVARKFTGVRKEGVMASSWPVIAAVAGLAGGLAGMLVTLTLKLRQRGALNEQLIIA